MDNGTTSRSDLLRLMGFMGVAIGIAWAAQILLGSDAQGVRLLWVVAAAAVSGAGVGAVAMSRQFDDRELVSVHA